MKTTQRILAFPKGHLILGDSLEVLKSIKDCSIHMIFADPPYFLSNGGISCHSGNLVSVDKGDWDKGKTPQEICTFTETWISECKRILHKNGTIWITGTFHNIFVIGTILKKLDFKILNMVTWTKSDPPPNLSQRMFTHSTEFIIWAKKSPVSKQKFNFSTIKKLNNNIPMTDSWILPHVPQSEKSFGYHPTQKPLHLLKRIIMSCTDENETVLDPFGGSGTTAVAALHLNRRFICIEKNSNYFNISKHRITHFSYINQRI
ncbi:MAG: site-specific DNA-methyltransferase [Ectobacillus sp.]